jgi:hypothetical protein
VSTRVIVHPASGNAEDITWQAYIQGQPDPISLRTLADLNTFLADYETDDGEYVYYGIAGCDGSGHYPCPLAATGTVLWAAPGAYHAARVCDTGQGAVVQDAIRLGYPHTVIAAPVQLPRSYFSSASTQDMAELTRALVGYQVDPGVYTQPVCSGCQARICLPYGSLQWADAEGCLECTGGAGHIPAVTELAPPGPDSADLCGSGLAIPTP